MAHEVVNSLFVHYAPSVCCQLDLSKAYDRVNWNFLRNSLLSLGFHDTWIAHIMTCVSTTSIAISVNGVVGQYFHSSRGLRQGDPMSPLLFIGIMECLHRHILHSVNTNKLFGPTIPRVGKAPVELFFVDHIIFFLPLKVKFLQEIKGIMGDFEMKAGMKVNDAKLRMVNFNAHEDLSNLSVASTGWPLASLPLNYLELPHFVETFSPDLCQPLIMKAQRKLAAWKASLLSYVVKLCLLQSSFVPLIFFWCSPFKLLKKIIQVLESLAANFLWASNLGHCKQHLVAWNKLCRSKGEGDVRLRSIKDLNRACLGNLAIRSDVGHGGLQPLESSYGDLLSVVLERVAIVLSLIPLVTVWRVLSKREQSRREETEEVMRIKFEF
ncbi:retrotransposable element ORF2 protein [Nymphaea thermarum]|nr:retrotransposable element ORF2 protein [Nymphaea thermarum]